MTSARCLKLFVVFVICVALSACQKEDKLDGNPKKKTVNIKPGKLNINKQNTPSVEVKTTNSVKEVQLKDTAFVVLTQSNSFHVRRAKAFQDHFNKQLEGIEKPDRPQLYLTHEKWDLVGAWTVLRLLPIFAEEFKDKAWVFVCEEETRVDLSKLLQVLKQYDHSKEYFLGKALKDSIATIIHHFAFANNLDEFPYPDFAAGVVMSGPLFVRFGNEFESLRSDFAIDPKHELAVFFHNEGKGIKLTDVPELCTNKITERCATSYPVSFPDCGQAVSEDDLFVGVKTCEKFHTTRVPVVKETWGNDAKHIEFYSETEDPSIPTVYLGVPNTERGHCGKTMAMLKRWHQDGKMNQKSWFLIADDDTIINLKRLRRLLACYNPKEVVHLGEQYGYSVAKNDWGYNYITGGGGMIFSKAAIAEMVKQDQLQCFTDDAPDDMTLGMKFKRMNIPLVHSPYFHQARPEDYSADFLAPKTALSFHKHWSNDPYKVYKDLMNGDLQADDLQSDSAQTSKPTKEAHVEL